MEGRKGNGFLVLGLSSLDQPSHSLSLLDSPHSPRAVNLLLSALHILYTAFDRSFVLSRSPFICPFVRSFVRSFVRFPCSYEMGRWVGNCAQLQRSTTAVLMHKRLAIPLCLFISPFLGLLQSRPGSRAFIVTSDLLRAWIEEERRLQEIGHSNSLSPQQSLALILTSIPSASFNSAVAFIQFRPPMSKRTTFRVQVAVMTCIT